MSFFVYIIYSETTGIYYKGFTTHPEKRLEEHNSGLSLFTSDKGPWIMVYLEECQSKTQALKREKALKRYNQEYLQKLIASSSNILEIKFEK